MRKTSDCDSAPGQRIDTRGRVFCVVHSVIVHSHRFELSCRTVLGPTPRNGNRANGNHLDQSLLSSRKNGNSLTWVLVALTVCFTYPVLYIESRPNLELASGNRESSIT